jgi:hypothetical protein
LRWSDAVVQAGVLAGNGAIRANGGMNGSTRFDGGAGGGGRVAVVADYSGFDPGRIVAAGGNVALTTGAHGGAGTVYLVDPREQTAVLIVTKPANAGHTSITISETAVPTALVFRGAGVRAELHYPSGSPVAPHALFVENGAELTTTHPLALWSEVVIDSATATVIGLAALVWALVLKLVVRSSLADHIEHGANLVLRQRVR